MNPDPIESGLNRRQFMVRTAKAAAVIAAAGAAGPWFHDTRGPGPLTQKQPQTGVLNFSVESMRGKMAIVRGSNRHATLNSALKAVGGMESFLKRGDRVLLKVNAAFASPPMLSATTHPDTVSAIAGLCYAAGAATVVVTDNPINDPGSCFTLSGISEAARRSGAKVYLPEINSFKLFSVQNAKLIRSWPVLLGPLENITKVIGLAPVKDHHRSGASLSMKNWYGLLGGRRNMFHQEINTIIAELALMVRPTLVILDGTVSMLTNGPTGGSLSDLKQTNTMVVSTDQVAADAFGVTLLGKSPEEIPYIAKAEAAGAGTADFRSLNPVELTL